MAKTALDARERTLLGQPAPAELRALWNLKKSPFFGDSEFGEVRFLNAGERPSMASSEGELPWDRAAWFAEEADGAAIGFLRLDGVALDAAPVVLLDNEGSLRVTGFSIADHFALGTLVAGEGPESLEPLVSFCRDHGLPGPRTSAKVKELIKKLGLGAVEEKLPSVDVKGWAKAVHDSTPASPAKAKPAPKPVKGAAKARPLGRVFGCTGPGGQPWFAVVNPAWTRTEILRWTGERFEHVGAQPMPTTSMTAFKGALYLALYDRDVAKGMRWENGAWSSFAFLDGHGGELLSDGEHALYCAATAKYGDPIRFSVWNGSGFSVLKAAPSRVEAKGLVDRQGSLYVLGGETPTGKNTAAFSVVCGGKAKALPACPTVYMSHVFLAHDLVIVQISEETYVYRVAGKGAGKWVRAKNIDQAMSAFVPLPDGGVAAFGDKSATVHLVDLAALKLVPNGALLLKKSSLDRTCLPTPDGRVIVAGEGLGTSSDEKKDPPAEPQIWNAKTGKTIAAPGLEAEMKAQIAQQAKHFIHRY